MTALRRHPMAALAVLSLGLFMTLLDLTIVNLAIALHLRAVAASGELPAQYRRQFVNGFSSAAHTGLEVGAGQSGANLQLPPQVQAIAHSVFTHGFVDAMHPTLVLPS